MGKQYVPWPDSELDRLVQRFFDKVGVDHRYVRTYRLVRDVHGPTAIEVLMHFDDEPAQAETTGLDQATPEHLPIVTADNPNIVKEG
jgi:hypothetical protein